MKFLNVVKTGFFLASCVFWAGQASAAIVRVDIAATITNLQLMNSTGNGISEDEDPNLWGLSNALPTGSNVNFSVYYNTNAPASSSYAYTFYAPQGEGTNTVNTYNGIAASINSPYLQINSATNNGVAVNNGVWDFFNMLMGTYFDSSGIGFSFQNENYYLIHAQSEISDMTGTVFSDNNLPKTQSQLDAFWLLNDAQVEYPYWGHLGLFEMSFVKDLAVNSIDDGYYPRGEMLNAFGYFDSVTLTNTEVPEPSELLIALIGMAGLFVRRVWKN